MLSGSFLQVLRSGEGTLMKLCRMMSVLLVVLGGFASDAAAQNAAARASHAVTAELLDASVHRFTSPLRPDG